MTLMLDNLEELKRRVEAVKVKKEQAQGAYNQLLKRIKDEFGCKTLQEAEAELMKLQNEEREAAKVYTKMKTAFQLKHAKVLYEDEE